LIGCGYCQWQRGFWVESSVSVNAPKKAFIRLGTNVFSDTAGNHIQFKYCPMCGKPLPSPPDNGGGRVNILAVLFPNRKTQRSNIIISEQGVNNHGKD